MEFFVLICVCLLAALWFFDSDRSSKGNGSRPRQNAEPQSKPKVKPLDAKPQQTPAPFEAKTARPISGPRAIRGAAYVIDGDSLVIQKTQVRLFGVDAPELNHPFGQSAKWALHRLCKGQVIHVEIFEQDAHGRTVAACYLPDGRDLSAEMVKLGLAIDWRKFSQGKYRDLEPEGVRKKLWLADARQKGRMDIWRAYEAKMEGRAATD